MKRQRIDKQQFEFFIRKQITGQDTELLKYGITVKDKIIMDDVYYRGDVAIHLENSVFVGTFNFAGNDFRNEIYIRNSYFLKGLHFIHGKASKKIIVMNCKVKGDFMIDARLDLVSTYLSRIEKVIIGDNAIMNTLEIGGKDESYMGSISFLRDCSIKRCRLANCKIERLSFSEIADDTEVFNCSINSFEFYKVRNKGSLKLLNCQALPLTGKKSAFVSNESNLGRAEFLQFRFSTFDQVNLIDSILYECLFVNTTWAKNIISVPIDKTIPVGRVEYHENIREVYRQIKYALSKQGDVINEHYFHALEMRSYDKTLSWSWKNLGTKVIIKLSNFLSDFGQSLWRPVRALIFGNGILFFVMIFNFNYKGFRISLEDADYQSTVNAFAEFIRLINPVHRNEPELQSWLLIIDIVMRVWSSYMIYNFIRATRRFIK